MDIQLRSQELRKGEKEGGKKGERERESIPESSLEFPGSPLSFSIDS